jgi:hypothetical protein
MKQKASDKHFDVHGTRFMDCVELLICFKALHEFLCQCNNRQKDKNLGTTSLNSCRQANLLNDQLIWQLMEILRPSAASWC